MVMTRFKESRVRTIKIKDPILKTDITFSVLDKIIKLNKIKI